MHNPAATPAAAAAAMCIAAPRRGPVEWGIFVQRAMNARFIIIRGILAQDPAQVRLPKYGHARRIVPISLSTYGFCHGDRGAVGLSRMPMARAAAVDEMVHHLRAAFAQILKTLANHT